MAAAQGCLHVELCTLRHRSCSEWCPGLPKPTSTLDLSCSSPACRQRQKARLADSASHIAELTAKLERMAHAQEDLRARNRMLDDIVQMTARHTADTCAPAGAAAWCRYAEV